MDRKDAVILKCTSYDYDIVLGNMKNMFDMLGGLDYLIEKDAKVLIKPNFVMKKSLESGIITHPVIIEAACELIKERTDNIVIAESPGGLYNSKILDELYEFLGLKSMAERLGITLNYDVSYEERCISENARDIKIIKPVLDSDIVVNIAKLKTHGMTLQTACTKNLYGAVPGAFKARYHFLYKERRAFSNFIIDICESVKPRINIIDGVLGMEGDGPTAGEPKKSNVLIGSTSPYLADVLGAGIMGIDPKSVPIIAELIKRKLIDYTLSDAILMSNLTKEEFGELITPFILPKTKSITFKEKVPKFIAGLVSSFLETKPYIDKETCIGCAKCVKACPASTIGIKNGKAKINYKNCIKCYCCQELCPEKAIYIK